MANGSPQTPNPRLDVWLDVACLFKTRSEAQRACRLGKVSVNGVAAKPHRDIKLGDELVIQRPLGRRQTIIVRGIARTHLAKADARLLYEDTTPAPTKEEVAMRQLERLYRATTLAPAKPDRRQQRQLRRLKRGDHSEPVPATGNRDREPQRDPDPATRCRMPDARSRLPSYVMLSPCA